MPTESSVDDRIDAYNAHARTSVLCTSRPYADRPQHLDKRLFMVRVVEPSRLRGYFVDDDNRDVWIAVADGDFEAFDRQLALAEQMRNTPNKILSGGREVRR